ncbi:MAG: Hpt domain-containing protein [Woeseiaceae bacterium]
MSSIDSNTLKWVKSEIDDTLKQAQTSLEAYVEDTDDESQIRFCINYLHQVHGTLQMVELHGAALAVEEMEKLSKAIFDDSVNNKTDAYETLMQGILQIPDYLEHLLAGNPDMPVVLLPLLNDIRAARNEALLSEGALFTPDLSVDAPAIQNQGVTLDGGLPALAKKLRHNYHLGLLSWFQNKNPKQGLQKIADVMSELVNAAESDEARRVFWIANGLIESLKDDGVDTSVAVKMLLGHVDRQVKKIIDEGELALDENPPAELEKNLLYYVATSTTSGEHTKEIKNAFNLDQIMPDTQTLEQARADLSAPNAALMKTVSSVIIEDISKVKDSLDVFVRMDEKDLGILESVNTSLTQMADTLAMLNLGVQREAVLKQSGVLKQIIEAQTDIDDVDLMDVAAAMIAVENSLSEISTARAASSIEVEEGADAGETALAKMQGAEQQKLLETVLDEAKVNLSEIKEVLTLFSQNNEEREALKSIPPLLEQIQGGLMILSLEDAANLLALTNNYIRQDLIKEKSTPEIDDMNHLADAISSIEYYMESMMGSWGQPDAILDVVKQSLQSLGLNTEEDAKHDSDEIEAVTTEEPQEIIEEKTSEDVVLVDTDTSLEEGLEILDTESLSLEEDSPSEISALEVNEEISLDDLALELTEPSEIENEITLDELTLDTGDFDLEGLSIEEEHLSVSEPVEDEKVELEIEPEVEIKPVASPEIAKSPSLLDDTIDDEIIEIFMEEAEEAYESISNFLPVWASNTSNEEPLKDIRRAYHTLKGSGRLVGAIDLGEFAWSVENMLNRLLDNTITASPELLEYMELAKSALPELFELFKVNQKPAENILKLMQFADALSKGDAVNFDELNTEIKGEASTEIEEAAAEVELTDIEIQDDNVQPEIELDAPIELAVEDDNIEESLSINELNLDVNITSEPELQEAQTPFDIDPVLLDIYRKEVATHVETLKEIIASCEKNECTAAPTLLRALHTLCGSSRTTGVDPIALTCGSFESYVKYLQDNEFNLPQSAISALNETVAYIEDTVPKLSEAGAELNDHSELLAHINALPRDLDTQDVVPVAIEAAPTNENLPLPDYDEELLEIFIEEGEEILDECDQVIHDWSSDPENEELVKELQRQLHTLKGGARMAGIAELGDLGHAIESLLTAVVDGHMKATKPMLDLVQRSQDRLAHMLDSIKENKGIAPAVELITEVDLMLQNRGEQDEVALSREVSLDEPSIEEVNIDATHDEVIEIIEPTEIEVVNELNDLVDQNLSSASSELSELEALEKDLNLELPELTLDNDSELILDDAVTENVISIDVEEELEVVDEAPITTEIIEATDFNTEKSKVDLVEATDDSDRRQSTRGQTEQVRVRADLLDNLVNFAGEVSIYRSRLEQQTNNFRYNITEFDDTVNRLREQLRQFEIETETQIEYKNEELSSAQENFDPLEMDRFTTMQHLSRAMMESLGDLDSLRGILNNLTRESETLLLQQSRVNTDLQEGLMRTRMVSFSGQASRIRRIVRQTCSELGKQAELNLEGIDSELDRSVLERIISPIEHMLRNAVAHGIETPEQRKNAGKPESGNIDFSISNEGANIVIRIKDDGAGINLEAVRKKGIEKGLIQAGDNTSKEQLLDMIMASGFSTAEAVSQIAGRGVGMDVVNAEIKQLGGVFNINTEQGKGTTFTVSLPLTLAITRALMVTIGDETYAIPLLSVDGVERIQTSKAKEIISSDEKVYHWLDEDYDFKRLGTMLGVHETSLDDEQQLPMLMVRSGEHRTAIVVDSLLGSREIVVKAVGPQLSTLRGVSGATIMGDGSVVLIIDLAMLIRLASTAEISDVVNPTSVIVEKEEDTGPLVMVVDDSITVRKVTTRLLERHEMRVVAAKDGVDALAQLQETIPDIMLLDVEMPRMDGFELATNMRNDEKLKNIPIIMITSRTGQKHRDRASSIGVNIYMGKPFTETDLMDNINVLTGQTL